MAAAHDNDMHEGGDDRAEREIKGQQAAVEERLGPGASTQAEGVPDERQIRSDTLLGQIGVVRCLGLELVKGCQCKQANRPTALRDEMVMLLCTRRTGARGDAMRSDAETGGHRGNVDDCHLGALLSFVEACRSSVFEGGREDAGRRKWQGQPSGGRGRLMAVCQVNVPGHRPFSGEPPRSGRADGLCGRQGNAQTGHNSGKWGQEIGCVW